MARVVDEPVPRRRAPRSGALLPLGWLVMNVAGLVLSAGFVGMLVEMGLVVAGSVDYMKHR